MTLLIDHGNGKDSDKPEAILGPADPYSGIDVE